MGGASLANVHETVALQGAFRTGILGAGLQRTWALFALLEHEAHHDAADDEHGAHEGKAAEALMEEDERPGRRKDDLEHGDEVRRERLGALDAAREAHVRKP